MKNVFVVGSVLLSLSSIVSIAQAAQPEYETRETVVHVTHNSLQVDLNEKTVICSHADYSMPMLKVLIPGLGDVTLLNHQNTGAGAPCVTTGETCRAFGTNKSAGPADILQGRNAVEPIDVVVTATRVEYINHTEKSCTVSLRENVETQIRGKRLFHERESELVARSYEDCLSSKGKVVAP